MDGNGTQTAQAGSVVEQTTVNNNATQVQNQSQSNTQEQAKGSAKEVDIDTVKNEAVSALLKELGYDDVETLKGVTTKVKEEEESKKSDLQKKDDALNELTKKFAQEHEARVVAEAKNEAIKLGAKPELVDDLVIIAKAKTTKDKDITTVIAEMKESASGSVYFVNDESNRNSGSSPKTVTRSRIQSNKNESENNTDNASDNHKGSIAERLLSGKKSVKSHYFK